MADKDAGNQPDVAALQAEVSKWKDKAQTFEAENTNYKKEYGWIKDVNKVKADLSAFEQMQRENAGGDPKKIQEIVDREVLKVKDQFSGKITELEQAGVQKDRDLKTLRVTSVAMQEAAKHFNADGLPLLQSVIDAATDWVDGKVVVTEGGKPRVSAKDPRKNMELPEFMEILAGQYPSLAKSQATSGGKPTGTTYANGGTRLTPAEFGRLDAQRQREYITALPKNEQGQFLNQLVQHSR